MLAHSSISARCSDDAATGVSPGSRFGRVMSWPHRAARVAWPRTAEDELAASGAHIARRDPTRRDQLTPSEHRIATMAADGNTNREIAQSLFLTVKTVEMHLSNAYRKLGVRSRHDLPEALAVT